MDKYYFSEQIEAAQERLATLEREVKTTGTILPEVQMEALTELSIALEELQVAEEELRHQNEELLSTRQMLELERQRYEDLFNFAPDGYLVTDPQGMIREANRIASLLLQVPVSFLVGKPLVLFVTSEDRRTLTLGLAALQAEGRTHSWELRLQPRDASPFYAAVTVAAKRNAEGRLTSLRWLIRDIRQRKQAEQILKESEAFNQAVLSSLRAHIAVLDRDGTIVAVNDAWALFAQENSRHFSNRTGVGMNYLEVCRQARGEAADEAGQALAGIQAVLDGSQPQFSLEYRCHSPIKKRWYLLNATPLSKRGYGAVVSHQDITEQKLMQEEKSKLLEEVSQQREQLRAVTARLAEVQEVERKRLVQELHDQLGRNLTALGLNLNIIETHLAAIELKDSPMWTHLNDSVTLVEQTTEFIRDVMADLRPPVLDDYGLVTALNWYGEQLTARTGLAVTVQSQESSPRLALQLENTLFRIAQEALTNVVKHARATEAVVTVEVGDEMVELVIADNGIGFVTARPAQNGDRPTWGLLTMSERAEAIGGHCWIESVLNEGTRVITQAPREVEHKLVTS